MKTDLTIISISAITCSLLATCLIVLIIG